MSRRIEIRPQASQDIDKHYNFIHQGNPDAALRFFDAVRSTIAQIARMPSIGNVYATQRSPLEGIRKWAVKGFRKYLIFYFDRDETVEIVRILYASQDISSILNKNLNT